jgi:hypothetical protein
MTHPTSRQSSVEELEEGGPRPWLGGHGQSSLCLQEVLGPGKRLGRVRPVSDEGTWEAPLGRRDPVVKNILIVPVI